MKTINQTPQTSGHRVLTIILSDLIFLFKYPALVLYYSEEGAGGAAFLCTTNMGKLLQHKLIHVQCTKKSTRVPVSPIPQYGYSV